MRMRERKREAKRSPGPATLVGALILVAVTAASVSAPATAQSTSSENHGSQRLVVPLSEPGQPVRLEVGLVMGSIKVRSHAGSEVIVEVIADKVEEQVEQVDGMFRIPNTGIGLEIEERDNEVEISTGLMSRELELVIQVPVETSMELSTVNGGEIVVEGVTGELELNNVNGPISALEITGSVVANTTNGAIEVSFVQITPDKPMSFSTWNGDVAVTFPAGLAGDLLMSAGQGEILSDFEVELVPQQATVEREEGRGYRVMLQKEVHGRVGGGGAEYRFKTYNGDILLKRRGG